MNIDSTHDPRAEARRVKDGSHAGRRVADGEGGFRARGGFMVDIAWKDGKVTSHRLTDQRGGMAKVRINGELKEATVETP
jgi:hypothetical protein